MAEELFFKLVDKKGNVHISDITIQELLRKVDFTFSTILKLRKYITARERYKQILKVLTKKPRTWSYIERRVKDADIVDIVTLHDLGVVEVIKRGNHYLIAKAPEV
jgi:hypothetical protein